MAGTLVETLHGDAIPGALALAYRTLATAFLAHRSRGQSGAGAEDAVALDRAVCATEDPVPLEDARAVCPHIIPSKERPGEIFDNLGHMFVLLQALSLLGEKRSLVPTRCAPTQQSKHDGVRISDLEGDGWALEAYGGVNVRNNSKLALDLQSLSSVREARPVSFLAFRQVAHKTIRDARDGESVQLSGTCSPTRGVPFVARASGVVVGRRDGVVVVEAGAIEVNYRTKD